MAKERVRIPKDLEERILDLSRQGLSAKQISDECGVHTRTVTRVRTRNSSPGITGAPPRWTKEDLDTAEFLLEEGASYRDTSETTRIPRTTLREKLPGRGWTSSEGGSLGKQLLGMTEAQRRPLIRKNLL